MSRFKLVALIAIPLVILGAGLVYAHQGSSHHGGPMREHRMEMHLEHHERHAHQDRRIRRPEDADRGHPQAAHSPR